MGKRGERTRVDKRGERGERGERATTRKGSEAPLFSAPNGLSFDIFGAGSGGFGALLVQGVKGILWHKLY